MTDDSLTYVAITRLHARYADAVTRRAWPELESLFAPDAPIRIDTVTAPPLDLTGPTALGQFIDAAVERFEHFQFIALNAVVDVTGADSASGRLFMVEVRQERGTREWSNAFGIYQDDFVRSGGEWRYVARRYQSLARRVGVEPASVFPFPAPPG